MLLALPKDDYSEIWVLCLQAELKWFIVVLTLSFFVRATTNEWCCGWYMFVPMTRDKSSAAVQLWCVCCWILTSTDEDCVVRWQRRGVHLRRLLYVIVARSPTDRYGLSLDSQFCHSCWRPFVLSSGIQGHRPNHLWPFKNTSWKTDIVR